MLKGIPMVFNIAPNKTIYLFFFAISFQCKFDFCWVCLEAWKKHSSATGGYFRCNRFPAASKADEKQGILISEVFMLNFLHFPNPSRLSSYT